MASLITLPGYKDYELLHFNKRNSAIVQRARSIENPTQTVICKGLTIFDVTENNKLKMEYEILKQVHEKIKLLVDGKLNSKLPATAESRRLDNLISSIYIETPHQLVAQPVGLLTSNDNTFLLMEDFKGETLRNYLNESCFEDFIIIGSQLAEALDIIHSVGVVHKDINPDNILIRLDSNKRPRVQLIDFNLSSMKSTFTENDVWQGTLAYISPEQTGRTGQIPDQRSDFYSLGITLWEVLMRASPYQFVDISDYIHAHLTIELPNPSQLDSKIPRIFSEIILKLAMKRPSDRFQSSYGLRCVFRTLISYIDSYKLKNNIKKSDKKLKDNIVFTILENIEIDLSSNDIVDKLLYHDELVGREKELNSIKESFARISGSKNTREFILISGVLGIGKTSLMSEVQNYINKTATFGKYYFNLVSGAFDSSAKNTSFSGILLMFKNLIHIFLSLPDEEFKFFNQKLLQDVGVENLELLNELIPDLSLLTNISKDTSKSFCNLIDKEKFTEALISLLKVAANENSPLVIHFDSIETADHDSIVFIERVLRDNSIHHLLVIATSRLSENNDIQNELLFQIFKVKSGETNSPLITRIILENLTANDVLTVISRTLCPLAENHADLKVLASITLSKTLGNPYHLREFLLLAEKNGFIYLDRKRAGWNWDIKGIENGMSISDNVLTLLSSRLKNLSAECMKIIKISACLGSKFEYSALKVISNESEGFIDEHLSILTSEGLISSTHKLSKQFRRLSVSSATPSVLRRGSIKSDYYNGSNTGSKEKFDAGSGTLNKLTETYKIEFRHERVRIAVLEYLSKEEEITIHYKIALMIASRQLDTSETPIEDAEHFNIASSMFSSNEEFFYAACLNYNASVEAKKNFSLILSKKLIYESLAFSERIEKDTSEFNFELDQLKYKIYKILAAAFETDGEYVEAENIYRKCLSLDISESEKVQVIQNLIDNFSLQFNSKKSFELIMEQLAYFGIEILSQNERIAYVQTEFKRLDEFLNQPLDTLISENRPAPSEISNCRQTLLFIASSTNESLGNYEMSDYLIIKCCILALEEGVGKRAALCFSCVSRVYYNLSITSKPDISKISKLYNIANNLIQSSSIEDKIAACYLQFDFGQSFLMSDKNVTLRNCVSLSKQSESNRYLKTAPYCLLICQVQHGQSILHLRDTLKLQPALANLKTEEHLKNAIDLLLEHLEALFQGNKLAETSPALPRSFRNDIELIRFISATIFERPEAGQLCKELNDIMSTQKSYSSYITVSVLTVRNLAIQFSNISIGSMSQQNKTAKPTALGISILKMIDEKISWLENFALENSPDHCKYLIALAERDRVNGNVWSAVCNYESAIENARRHDATLWEALATELLAKLFLLQGNKRLAKHCINSALNVWKLWGSQAKINQLKAQFPDLVDQAAFTAQEVSFGSFKQHKATSSTPSNSLGNNFDVTTLLKVTQSITNESNLEELLKKILSYIMVNASAKKGVLLINDNRKLFVQAYASDDHETKIISPPRELENLEGDISLPISIILFVYRSREVVVLSDAIHDNVYQNDSYVKANLSKSILCVPIVHQNTVNGVIYLENKDQVSMFSHERVELIKSLMTSTSVAIENSKLTRHIIDLKAQNFAAKEVSVNTSAPKYNIDAPLKKTIDMLSKMRAAVKKDDKSITQLDFVLKMLTSSDLFAASIDDINDEQGRGIDQDTKSWIENSLLEKDTRRINNHRSDSSSSITITQEFDIESPTESSSVFKGSIQDPLLINSAQIIKILDSSSTQNFNVLELAEATGGRPLYYLSIHILEKYGIVRHFGLNEGKMRRFLENIESSYHNLPYHNSSHAADVLYTVNMMLFSDSKVGSHFSKIEVFAACIASSVHDVDHPGLNNNFLVQTGQRVAILYNDTSVLEFHHCSKTFQIASEENANIFSSLTNDQYRDCRKLVLSMVLATDMSQHFQYVNKLKGKIAASSLKMEDSADRNLVLDMAIKCADLNNPSKPTDQSIQWAYRVMREFFAQGDLEQKVGIPVSKFYDRENTNIPRCQIGFIDVLVAPLFESWSQLFNSDFTVYCRDNITRNRSYWESVLNENIKIEDSKEERSNLVKIRESEDGFFFQESEDPSKISQPRRYRAHPPQKVPILKRSATISEGKRQDLLDVHSSRNILKSNGNIRNSGESIMKM